MEENIQKPQYKRICPTCGKEIIYDSQTWLNKANAIKKECKTCQARTLYHSPNQLKSNFQRNCPICHKEIFYNREFNYNRAAFLNSKCHLCKLKDKRNLNPEIYKDRCNKYKLKNKQKCKKYMDNWRKENGFTIRKWYLKYHYGISTEDYNKLFIKQEGKCKICGKHQSELKVPLCVDHCHHTNMVRGLLCTKCNAGLGNYNDDIILFQNAVNYLNSFKNPDNPV
jgi:hypothetical protein